MKIIPLLLFVLSVWLCGCGSDKKVETEELKVPIVEVDPADTTNAVKRDVPLSSIATFPQQVILTGMPRHRLVSVYKYTPPAKNNRSEYYSYESYGSDEYSADGYTHFMPGIDLQFGYNMVNVAHYDLTTEKLNYLFERPVLIKSVYYPSYEQDSVGIKPNRKPINRDYFLVSAFDEDTNQDTLLNRHDLRRFYHFNASCDVKTRLIPPDYSVTRSQYDDDNDIMYVYAVHDDDGDGRAEKNEAQHIFWLSLKAPAPAKRLY